MIRSFTKKKLKKVFIFIDFPFQLTMRHPDTHCLAGKFMNVERNEEIISFERI